MRAAPERAGIQTVPPLRTDLLEAEYRRRLRGARLGLLGIAIIVVLGTLGYSMLEGWPLGDSLYMVMITLSTVGFREVHELSGSGRMLTVLLIFTGVASFAYVAANFARLAIEGGLRDLVGRRRMDKEIARLHNHFIVCGFGRVGSEICGNLIAENVRVVVVELDPTVIDTHSAKSAPFVVGDAVEESVLRAAGLDSARGLLLTLSNEADNVYVTLLVKDLRPELLVIARGISEQGERRLLAAGADRVVSPERIGATAMSNSALRPTVVDFAEIATAHHNLELQLEEQQISEASELVGRSIAECGIRQRFGIIVAAVVTAEGEMLFNPEPQYSFEAGATLIILGKREDLARFATAT